jgi:hypothetical protein
VANYLLAYTGGGRPESDEEQQQVYAAWGAWFGALGAAVVDGGNPVGAAKSISPGGSVADGGQAGLTGYSILSADDLDAAVALAQDCPLLDSGGSIQVYEIVPAM